MHKKIIFFNKKTVTNNPTSIVFKHPLTRNTIFFIIMAWYKIFTSFTVTNF